MFIVTHTEVFKVCRTFLSLYTQKGEEKSYQSTVHTIVFKLGHFFSHLFPFKSCPVGNESTCLHYILLTYFMLGINTISSIKKSCGVYNAKYSNILMCLSKFITPV